MNCAHRQGFNPRSQSARELPRVATARSLPQLNVAMVSVSSKIDVCVNTPGCGVGGWELSCVGVAYSSAMQVKLDGPSAWTCRSLGEWITALGP